MNTSEFIIDAATNSGLTEWGLIKTVALRFYPQIRQICEGNSCRGYGKTWACPPAVGTLEECTNRVLQYENMLLFSQKFELEDSFDFESMEHGMKTFKVTVDRFAEAVKEHMDDTLILSNEGCGRCRDCTYPDALCRFPDKLYPSIEASALLSANWPNRQGSNTTMAPIPLLSSAPFFTIKPSV